MAFSINQSNSVVLSTIKWTRKLIHKFFTLQIAVFSIVLISAIFFIAILAVCNSFFIMNFYQTSAIFDTQVHEPQRRVLKCYEYNHSLLFRIEYYGILHFYWKKAECCGILEEVFFKKINLNFENFNPISKFPSFYQNVIIQTKMTIHIHQSG